MIEWSITQQCNFECDYCGLYDNTLERYLPDLNQLKIIMDGFQKEQEKKEQEVFIYGGEPFLHKNIKEIIIYMNTKKIPFVIQTNLSKKSTSVILNLIETGCVFNINISVHSSQQSPEIYINCINKLLKKGFNGIKIIDIMWEGIQSTTVRHKILDSVKGIKKEVLEQIVILAPVSNFLVEDFNSSLKEFNKFKRIFKDGFEDILVQFEGQEHKRSILWEDFNSGDRTTKGKPCSRDNYSMIDWNGQEYNCSWKDNVSGDCPYESCFL